MRMGDECGDQTDQEDAAVDDQEQPAHDRPAEARLPALLVDDAKSHRVLPDARARRGLYEHEIEDPDERSHAFCLQEGAARPQPRVASQAQAHHAFRRARDGGAPRAQDRTGVDGGAAVAVVLHQREHRDGRGQDEQAVDHVRRDPATEHFRRIARGSSGVSHSVILAQTSSARPDAQRSRKLR